MTPAWMWDGFLEGGAVRAEMITRAHTFLGPRVWLTNDQKGKGR